MNIEHQSMKEDDYLYFRFTVKDRLRDKIKAYLIKRFATSNPNADKVLNEEEAENYQNVIKSDELENFLDDIKNTNLTLYRIKTIAQANALEITLKTIQEQAYILFTHEMKMRFLFHEIPKDWENGQAIKQLFYEYFAIETTRHFITMQEKSAFKTVNTLLLGPREQDRKYTGYVFCVPSLQLSNFCGRMLTEHKLAINNIPLLMQRPFIIKIKLMHDLTLDDFHNYINTRSKILVQNIQNQINFFLDSENIQLNKHGQQAFDEWIHGLSIDPQDSLIDNFNVEFYETTIRIPNIIT